MVARFRKKRLLLGLCFIGAILLILLYLRSTGVMIDFSMIKMYRMDIEAYLMQNLFLGALGFTLMYIIVIGLSLPFATPLTVLSGFLFGTALGTGIVAVAASVGATLSVIINRFFFRDFVEYKFERQLRRLNTELSGHSFKNILLLRLAPIVPFALINIFSAVTAVRIRDFFFATLIGTIPFTFVYVNAGTRLAELQSVSDILEPKVIVGASLIMFAILLPSLIRRRSRVA